MMNRRIGLKVAGLAVVLFGGSTLGLGQAEPRKPAKVVEAEAFIVRDQQGQRRAQLGLLDGEPGLTLYDAAGQRRMRLTILADGSSRLVFFDEMGKDRHEVRIGPNGEPSVSPVATGGNGGVKPAGPVEIASAPVQPAKGDEVVRRGEPLYRQYCASCHANDGHGTRVRGRMPKIPDFGDAKWQQSRTDSQFLVSILEGRGKDMPPFNAELGPDDARALAAYVRSLGGMSPGRAAPLSDFEAQMRELQKQWDELDRQVRALREGAK